MTSQMTSKYSYIFEEVIQLVEIYQSNISEHIKHVLEDKELDEAVVVRKFRTTTQYGAIEGKTQSCDVAHYNLVMIIALGYRVNSIKLK